MYNPVNAIRSLQMHRMNASPVNVIGLRCGAFSTFAPSELMHLAVCVAFITTSYIQGVLELQDVLPMLFGSILFQYVLSSRLNVVSATEIINNRDNQRYSKTLTDIQRFEN